MIHFALDFPKIKKKKNLDCYRQNFKNIVNSLQNKTKQNKTGWKVLHPAQNYHLLKKTRVLAWNQVLSLY